MVLNFLQSLLKRGSARETTGALPREKIRSVLAVEVTRLGDVLTALPALRLMQRSFSLGAVHLLVDDRYASLLNALDLNLQAHGIVRSSSVRGFGLALLEARKFRFDLVCSMSPAKRNVLLTLATQAHFKVGYLTFTDSHIHYLVTTEIESLGFSLQKSVKYGRDHIEDRALKVCEALGLQGSAEHEPLHLRRNVWEPLRSRLLSTGILPGRPYVVIHPFAGWRYKRWEIGNFCSLANVVVERLGYDVVFVGEKEESQALEIARNLLLKRDGVHIFPSSDLTETAVLLQGAALFVGNDSGPLHLAAALGAKVIGLFGPAPPELTAPRAAAGVYFYHKVECSPCDQLKCIRPDRHCMATISVEEVLGAVTGALAPPGMSPRNENGKS